LTASLTKTAGIVSRQLGAPQSFRGKNGGKKTNWFRQASCKGGGKDIVLRQFAGQNKEQPCGLRSQKGTIRSYWQRRRLCLAKLKNESEKTPCPESEGRRKSQAVSDSCKKSHTSVTWNETLQESNRGISGVKRVPNNKTILIQDK